MNKVNSGAKPPEARAVERRFKTLNFKKYSYLWLESKIEAFLGGTEDAGEVDPDVEPSFLSNRSSYWDPIWSDDSLMFSKASYKKKMCQEYKIEKYRSDEIRMQA